MENNPSTNGYQEIAGDLKGTGIGNDKNTQSKNEIVTDEQLQNRSNVHKSGSYDQLDDRDEAITSILNKYKESYENKVEATKEYRKRIYNLCSGIIIFICVIFGLGGCAYFSFSSSKEKELLLPFITSCVSFVSLIFGLMTIITKYFFPENDEEYITKIVDSIQDHDIKKDLLRSENNVSYNNLLSSLKEDYKVSVTLETKSDDDKNKVKIIT